MCKKLLVSVTDWNKNVRSVLKVVVPELYSYCDRVLLIIMVNDCIDRDRVSALPFAQKTGILIEY